MENRAYKQRMEELESEINIVRGWKLQMGKSWDNSSPAGIDLKCNLQEVEGLIEEVKKEYRECKREHCDYCDDEECYVCKPEFDKLRAIIKICEKILNEK